MDSLHQSIAIYLSIYLSIYIYIYIQKLERNIYCCYTPVKLHRRLCHYPLFFPIFLQFFFLTFTYFFNIYTYYNLSPFLTFSSPHYFNITLHLSLILALLIYTILLYLSPSLTFSSPHYSPHYPLL